MERGEWVNIKKLLTCESNFQSILLYMFKVLVISQNVAPLLPQRNSLYINIRKIKIGQKFISGQCHRRA